MKIPFSNWTINLRKNAPENQQANRKGVVMSTNLKFNDYKLSFEDLFVVYRQHSDVRNCVRELRQNVGLNGWTLIDKKDPKAEPNPSDMATLTSILNYLMPP